MSIELRPLGVNCNIACQYCYQNLQRDAGNLTRSYDLEAMKEAIETEGGPFTLFGGEPLMVPVEDLEDLWAWGLERFGSNGVQTNGSLITDRHIELFKKYRVHVGISVDGPGALNDARWAGSPERTRQATEKTEQAIERLCSERIPPSLILTLHRTNATSEKLPRLQQWVLYLESIGVRSIRLHLLEVESAAIRRKYALTPEENIRALRSFRELQKQLKFIRFDVFEDMEKLLFAQDAAATCVWMACDPNTTRAVRGVEGRGQRSNCGRTNKDGVDFTKSDSPGFERYLALYQTPQEWGGCQGCRFFLMCKGQCPGTAIDGDWRNRTEHCEIWKTLFRELEEEALEAGRMPISAHPVRTAMEKEFLRCWSEGQNTSMSAALEKLETAYYETVLRPHQGAASPSKEHGHGDHWDDRR